MKRILSIIMSGVLALSAASCSYMSPDAEYPVKIAGYTFEKKPESIVCLDDSVADILIACGYAELIKARSDECTQEEIEEIKTVGSEKKPDVKKIISAKPDVVFADKTLSGDVRNRLEEENINILTMVKAKNSDDLSVLYESICAVAGGDKSGRKKGSEKAHSVVTTMGDLQRIIPESKFLTTACYMYDTDGNVVSAGAYRKCEIYAVHLNCDGFGYFTVYFAPEPQVNGLSMRTLDKGEQMKLVLIGYDAFAPFTAESFSSFLHPEDISLFTETGD